MKKYLQIILFFYLSIAAAQQLPIPFVENGLNNSQKSTRATSFEEILKNGKTHFKSVDIFKKGSGYKPFKRWEYHWSHYLLENGTIAPAETLWNAWEQKQKMAEYTKATSNWVPVGPFSQSSNSGQGRINTIIVDPNNANTIYVGAPAGGLWKSTDAGVSWTPLTDHLPQIGVSGIAIDPNNSNIIYISTGDDDAGDSYAIGVRKSIDGGVTWSPTGFMAGNPTSSNEIFIDPTNSNIIWVATSSGLFQSTNAGVSWTRKLTGHIRDFRLKPNDPNTIYAVTSQILYTSTNGGTSFSNVSVGLPVPGLVGRLRVEVTPSAPNNVYILAAKTSSNNYAFEGVYKSTNFGVTFNKTVESDDIFSGSTQAWYDLAFTVSPANQNTMFVGVLDIWKSTNEGNDFLKMNDWRIVNSAFTHADIHFLRYFGNVLYAGTDGGIYKSTDNGVTFTDLTKNLAISQFYKVTVSKQNSNKLAGGLQDNGGFSLSNNTWHNYHGGDGMDSASDPSDENKFYGFVQYGSDLAITTNGGVNGSFIATAPTQETGTQDTGGNWVTPLVINKAGDIYAGYSQLYELIDNSWSQVSNHSFGGDLEAIEVDPNNNNNIYVSRGLNIYKSSDKGQTFTTITPANSGITGNTISSIEVHNSNSDILWLTTAGVSNLSGPSSGHNGGGVFKSVDGGLTFSNITSGLPNESKFIVRHHPFTTNNSIYVGTALGVYHRNDDDNIWEVFSTNLPNVAVPDLEINPYDNTITVGTYGRSVWQSAIPSITLPANDIDLIKISSPSKSVTCSDVNPSIAVTNNGQNIITSVTITYNVDGGSNSVFNWTGSITSNATETINLPSITGLSEGNHSLNVTVAQTNDSNLFNNNATSNFIVNQVGDGQITYTFGDLNPNADQNANQWLVSDNNVWEIGTPTTTNLNLLVNSGYVTNPSGNYPDKTTSYLTSPCYNLASLVNPVLKFKMAFDLEENWDVVYMEYTTDQGQNWNVLGTAQDPNWYNSSQTNASSGGNNCFNCPGAQWTGQDFTLKDYSYDLTALNGESNIIFRFTFISDEAVNEEGVVIDAFLIDATAVLDIDDFDEGEFLIYPNPSSEIFNIKRANTANGEMTIKVYDVMGKLIRFEDGISATNYPLDMSRVAKGIYFLNVNIENKRLVKKLILK